MKGDDAASRPAAPQGERELAEWNDRMYAEHATPYTGGIAGRIQRARVETLLRLGAIGADDAVLELGCEAGRLLVEVPPCRRLVGADISGRALADAAALFLERGRDVDLRQLDAQHALPFERGEFDVVICSDMLEHVPQPRLVLENLHAIADRSTRVLLTVPIEGPKLVLKRMLGGLGLMNVLFPGIEEGQSHWHLHAFSRAMLHELSHDLFELERGKNVWGCHYAGRFTARDRSSA